APAAEALTVSSLEAAQTLGCGSVLSLVQELSQEERVDCPRLWLVTRGAQAGEQTLAAPAVAQAPVWGFGRALAQEHPTFWGGLVDLDLGVPPQDGATQLWETISHPDGEDQLAFRHGQRYVARLVRTRLLTAQQTALRWRSDGTYLITGGLGDLGLLVARWM